MLLYVYNIGTRSQPIKLPTGRNKGQRTSRTLHMFRAYQGIYIRIYLCTINLICLSNFVWDKIMLIFIFYWVPKKEMVHLQLSWSFFHNNLWSKHVIQLRDLNYYQFKNANDSNKDYMKSGMATFKFLLINMRSDFSFALFSGGFSNVCS